MSRTAREQAIDWLIRQRDPAFADWEPFTDWLEADPANNEAYSELAAREDALAERLAPDPFVQDNEAPSQRPFFRRPWTAGLTGTEETTYRAVAPVPILVIRNVSLPETSCHTLPGSTVVSAGGTYSQRLAVR